MILRQAYNRSIRRKWVRRAGAVAALGSAISAVLILRAVYLAVTARRGDAIDYGSQVYEFAAKRQGASTDDRNGFDDLQAVCAKWDEIVSDLTVKYGADAPAGEAAPEDFAWPVDPRAAYSAEASEIAASRAGEAITLARARSVFADLDVALDQPWISPAPSAARPLLVRLQPHLGAWRRMARVLMADAAIHLSDGEPDEAIADWACQLRLASVATRQETMIGYLVGLAIASQALDQIRFAAVEQRLELPQLRQCLVVLRDMRLGSYTDALAAARIEELDVLQWMHTDDGHGSGRRMVREWGEPSSDFVNEQYTVLDNMGGLRLPKKHQVVARMEEFYAGATALAALPRFQRSPAVFDLDAFQSRQTGGYEFLVPSHQVLEKSQRVSDRIQLDVMGVRAVIAVELFRAQEGRLPESLDEAAALLDGDAPIDTFTTGKPLIYRRINGPQGESYLLYAVGADGVDNNGALPAGHPVDALDPDLPPGTDFVVNRER